MGSGFDSAEFGDFRRPVTAPPEPPPTPHKDEPEDAPWVTVRQAADATGIPMSTIRGWYRRGRVTSRSGDRPGGPRVEVRMDEVRAHARTRSPRSAPTPAPPPSTDPVETPAGVLVPLDSWQQLLRQLGNLHEAGRDLAEARERAARAETEARFLRERLAELRQQLAPAPTPEPPAAAPTRPTPGPAVTTPADRSIGMRIVTRIGRVARPLGRRRR